MSEVSGSTGRVGNDFVLSKKPRPVIQVTAIEEAAYHVPVQLTPVAAQGISASQAWQLPALPQLRMPAIGTLAHRYSVATFALLFLVVGSSAIGVVNQYLSAKASASSLPVASQTAAVKKVAGFNMTVPATELDAKLQAITGQPIKVMVGDQPSIVQSDTIRSWLQVTKSASGSEAYIHVNSAKIRTTLNTIAADFTKAPVNQVAVSHADGTGSVIATGRNGTKVSDPTNLTSDISKNLLFGAGMGLNLPTETQAFQAFTPANFEKMIEVNVTTKQMYLWQNGQVYKQYPISAGAPKTPTPIGQYKIFSKLAVQDMKGFNADGTKYFQPHVRWVSYFLPGGYAIHGNYWRPTSWFGNINSSHGCASLPDYQAKEVYDWAPMGTTVITHA